MLEGCRLRAAVALFRDVARATDISDYAPAEASPADPTQLTPQPVAKPVPENVHLPAGSRVLVDIASACHDASAFPDPEKVDVTRPIDSYLHYGWGPHSCLGAEVSRVALTSCFKQIVGLKGLKATPGGRGKVKSQPAKIWRGQVDPEKEAEDGWTGLRNYMTADQSSYWPVPSTLRVQWE